MGTGPFHIPGDQITSASTTSVGQVFTQTAHSYAGQMAVDDGVHALTYGEFNQRVNRLANAMLAMGVHQHDRIALLSRNSIPYLEVMLACAKIGAIACCQNWRLLTRELSHCISLVSPVVIFAESEFHGMLNQSEAGTDPGLCKVIGFGEEYEQLLARSAAAEPQLAAGGENGLLILYTSGTTGLPKGAFISHRAALFRALVYASELHVPANDTFFAWSPLFHIGASDHSLATLMRGGRVFVVNSFRPEVILPALERNRTQWLSLLPGVTDQVIEAMKSIRPNLLGVGIVGGMADLISADQVAEISELFQAPYLDSFGSTETGLAPGTGALIPIGVKPKRLLKRQTGFCEVRLVDEAGQEVPDGRPGEVIIRGPALFSGYVQNPVANEESFRGGWFHMGDVMIRTPGLGTLEFVDRLKYLIKSGGENIYPAELERVILTDPRVDEVSVVRQKNAKWGEVPVAFIARNDESLTQDMVLAACLELLPKFKSPKAVRFIQLDEFPRGSTGKIKRADLEKLLPAD